MESCVISPEFVACSTDVCLLFMLVLKVLSNQNENSKAIILVRKYIKFILSSCRLALSQPLLYIVLLCQGPQASIKMLSSSRLSACCLRIYTEHSPTFMRELYWIPAHFKTRMWLPGVSVTLVDKQAKREMKSSNVIVVAASSDMDIIRNVINTCTAGHTVIFARAKCTFLAKAVCLTGGTFSVESGGNSQVSPVGTFARKISLQLSCVTWSKRSQ